MRVCVVVLWLLVCVCIFVLLTCFHSVYTGLLLAVVVGFAHGWMCALVFVPCSCVCVTMCVFVCVSV